MTEVELRKVCRWINEGGLLSIHTDDLGGQKIKVEHGPQGMFVHRFEIAEDELLQLKAFIMQNMNAQAA